MFVLHYYKDFVPQKRIAVKQGNTVMGRADKSVEQ